MLKLYILYSILEDAKKEIITQNNDEQIIGLINLYQWKLLDLTSAIETWNEDYTYENFTVSEVARTDFLKKRSNPPNQTIANEFNDHINSVFCYSRKIQQLLESQSIYKSEIMDVSEKAMHLFNYFIIAVEEKNDNKVIVDYLKNNVYGILYREELFNLSNLDSSITSEYKDGFVGIIASAVIFILFFAQLFFALPDFLVMSATLLFIWASAYLSAVLYFMVSNLLSAQRYPFIFLSGFYGILPTHDKVAQGLARGLYLSSEHGFKMAFWYFVGFWVLGSVSAALLPAAPVAFVVTTLTCVLPFTMIVMPILGIIQALTMPKKAPLEKESIDSWARVSHFRYEYTLCPTKAEMEKILAWKNHNDCDNHVWLLSVFCAMLAPLLATCFLSSVEGFLSAALFQPQFMALALTITPLFAALISVVLLEACYDYIYANHDKKNNNRYREKLDSSTDPENLLLCDKEKSYIRSVLLNMQTVASDEDAGNHHEFRTSFM